MYYLDYKNSFSVASHIKLTFVESYFQTLFFLKNNHGVRLITITFRNFLAKIKFIINFEYLTSHITIRLLSLVINETFYSAFF